MNGMMMTVAAILILLASLWVGLAVLKFLMWSSSSPPMTPPPPSGSSELAFAVLAIGKNEGMVVDEWVRHYLWQGAERIYYIDNDSSDDTESKLAPWISKGLVSYHRLTEPHKQIDHYNTVFEQHIRNRVTWLAVVDLDEFMYHRTAGLKLSDYIKGLDPRTTCSVWVRWKLFGSSGHRNQPDSVRKAFTMRSGQVPEDGKSIVSVQNIQSIGVHTHSHKTELCQTILDPPELALNHYNIMSREYFKKVKLHRGDVLHSGLDAVRNWDYFSQFDDASNVEDRELADLVTTADEG